MKNIFLLLLLFTGMVEAQIVNIPDANFKAALIADGIDTSGDGEIQTLEAFLVNQLHVDGENISNLIGLSSFVNVTALYCDNNNITFLDLSGNPNINYIKCSYNQLSFINLSNNPNLTDLLCDHNNLNGINLSNNPNVTDLWLFNNNLTTLDVSSCSSLRILSCGDNLLTSLNLSTNLSLTDLQCARNQLTSMNVSGLANLNRLYCLQNQLTSLNLSGLTALRYLDCSNNQLTAIDFSGLDNLQSVNCLNNIQLTSIDLSGHTSLTTVSIGSNDIANPSINFTTVDLSGTSITSPTISLSIIDTLNLTNCANLLDLSLYTNVVSNVILTGCNAVQLLDLRCILTALDVSNMTNLQYLNISGSNSIPSLDLSHNINLYSLKCDEYNPETLDLSNNINLTELVCASNNLKYLIIKNGSNYIPLDNLEWTLGGSPNLLYVCVDESELSMVQSIPVFPTTVIGTYCSVPPGGNYNTITGTMAFDADNNGCDALDYSQPNIRVNINDGTNEGASFTGITGNYIFYTQAGNFEITPAVENPTWFNFSPATATIPFADNNNNSVTQDFCIASNGVHHDAEMVISPVTPARPGFDAVYQLTYKNKGNQTDDLYLNFTYNDNLLDFVSATGTVTQGPGFVQSVIAGVHPFESGSINITLHVNAPTDTPAVNVGDLLHFTSFVDIATDENWADNAFTLNQTVVGSYDPNDITCLEGDVVAPSEIGNYLHYAINFENTGNFPAENVVVKTEVDASKFDINSLQLMHTNFPVDARITGNKVEFIFENIQLPIGGHGHILLKIKTQNSLVTGDAVAKRADIFFDYNAPVDTGLANTVFQTLSNSVFEVDSSIAVYPNPATTEVTVKANNNIKSIQLYDAQGRIVMTSLIDDLESKWDISTYSKGIYFLKITTEKGINVQKLFKN